MIIMIVIMMMIIGTGGPPLPREAQQTPQEGQDPFLASRFSQQTPFSLLATDPFLASRNRPLSRFSQQTPNRNSYTIYYTTILLYYYTVIIIITTTIVLIIIIIMIVIIMMIIISAPQAQETWRAAAREKEPDYLNSTLQQLIIAISSTMHMYTITDDNS